MPDASAGFWLRRWGLLVAIGVALPNVPVFAQTPPPGPAAAVAAAPGRPPLGLISTHAQSTRRLPNTVSDAVVSIEVHGRDLRGTATAAGPAGAGAARLPAQGQTDRAAPHRRARASTPRSRSCAASPTASRATPAASACRSAPRPEQLPLRAGRMPGATAPPRLGQFGSSPREARGGRGPARHGGRGDGQRALAQARAVAGAAVGQRDRRRRARG